MKIYNEISKDIQLKRKKLRDSFKETKKWLDLDSFIDCNMKEYESLTNQLCLLKEQIEAQAMKAHENQEISDLYSQLRQQKEQYRLKFMRNLELKQNNDMLSGKDRNGSDEIIERTTKLQQLSKELISIQDGIDRYQKVSGCKNFFQSYEKLCRQCEKLRVENEGLQILAGVSNNK